MPNGQTMPDGLYEGNNEYYEPPNIPLIIPNPQTYIQPWSGYNPTCTRVPLSQCKYFPSQTSNIKPYGVYTGLELIGNKWLRLACQAAIYRTLYPYAAVIVQIDNETNTILRYWLQRNQVTATSDITAHAELLAIRRACQDLGVLSLSNIPKGAAKLPQQGATSRCELYANAEPCAMCYSASYWANIPAIYFAATRFDLAQQGVGNDTQEKLYMEVSLPYQERTLPAYQCTVDNSLDTYNLLKRSPPPLNKNQKI
ncbi:hypothetical protein A374_06151 [Fictibacillus macauensis ZFHKF-1]|uniref:CMP/dCMP-type deaminase domain-containing protein n=1 Tax=Fictibacillus macauensis ZFHKF-1 TaxID=1196324 RepID=I8UH68_9BACL|nr:nucleoside deaminase [Fictibacillus macauensis]EIT86158.1 hypothetical protein A374_06151 [Fictibacillus macauensis ZFHKF-1]